MSSLGSEIPAHFAVIFVHLLIIFLAALLVNRVLRLFANSFVETASSQSRAAQAREQQTRAVADTLYRVGNKIVWVLAALLAAQESGLSIIPVVIVIAVGALAFGFGAQQFVRDAIAGFYIVAEDQFTVGDTIQVGETVGRVEHLTLRRTVVRDLRGALVTIANGELRTVGNLSRDWSQAFVDVTVSPDVPQEDALQALDTAAADLRKDPAWSQALVDGPRILGLQSYDQTGSTVRMQVRTAPCRQDDVARELRRRIQLEFQRQGIALSNVQRVELVNASAPNSPVSA